MKVVLLSAVLAYATLTFAAMTGISMPGHKPHLPSKDVYADVCTTDLATGQTVCTKSSPTPTVQPEPNNTPTPGQPTPTPTPATSPTAVPTLPGNGEPTSTPTPQAGGCPAGMEPDPRNGDRCGPKQGLG